MQRPCILAAPFSLPKLTNSDLRYYCPSEAIRTAESYSASVRHSSDQDPGSLLAAYGLPSYSPSNWKPGYRQGLFSSGFNSSPRSVHCVQSLDPSLGVGRTQVLPVPNERCLICPCEACTPQSSPANTPGVNRNMSKPIGKPM